MLVRAVDTAVLHSLESVVLTPDDMVHLT